MHSIGRRMGRPAFSCMFNPLFGNGFRYVLLDCYVV
ncbi:hypothetical protein CLOBOL_03522 [Enterocloster bolteae ATCC BAA-613]|uniref:Uncharacterized protein n=1 Tax=Enterocloster bolteae (strain ATCC BAA-613 / DSM 15670 / CCUG 46953 / JCM 12243 / WAL 16351) TaxID=411902 RepID=A8RT23_ENTBW|nr:hypothetical protein CLOBOL_03522 [Enterocloster bolteae ATCC BAA-613]